MVDGDGHGRTAVTWHPPTMARRAVARTAPEPRTRGRRDVSAGYGHGRHGQQDQQRQAEEGRRLLASPDVFDGLLGAGRDVRRPPCQRHCTSRRLVPSGTGPEPARGRPLAGVDADRGVDRLATGSERPAHRPGTADCSSAALDTLESSMLGLDGGEARVTMAPWTS